MVSHFAEKGKFSEVGYGSPGVMAGNGRARIQILVCFPPKLVFLTAGEILMLFLSRLRKVPG